MTSQPSGRGLLSPHQVGDLNRSRVLQVLCEVGPQSRADLAKLAGVTRATIGNIVQSLIDAGLLEEGEPQTGMGRVGKPGTPVWFGPRAGLTGAVAIGVGTIDAALVNARGDVLDSDGRTFDIEVDDPTAIVAAAAAGLRRVLPRDAELLGLGVAVPGVVDTASGTVVGSGQVPALAGAGLVEGLARAFDHPVMLDNDSRAQALGEKWFGDGRGINTFVSVQTGHGLGVGMVIDRTVFRGRHGLTGELGHTSVDPSGAPCRCGLRGCWETVATLPWLRAEAKRRRLAGAAHLDGASLVALAARSPAAAQLLDDYADNLSCGLATLVQLLNPDAIILHGDAAAAGEPLRARVEACTQARTLRYLRSGVRVLCSSLDQRATLLGAAGLVLSETFHLTS